MKIKLNETLKDLSGKELKEESGKTFTLGKALSNILGNAESHGKMKLFILAQDCFKKDTLEVDTADFNLIKETVKETKIYKAMIAGQCEMLLEEIKEK